MTTIQTIVFAAATWMPRERPDRAVMPILVKVERRTSALVPDLCWELDRKLSWAVFGESVIPLDSYPLGVITGSSAQHVKAAVIISVDPNQSQPEYEQGSWEPSVSEVRLLVSQATTTDFDDLELFISRRADLRRVLSRLEGGIGT